MSSEKRPNHNDFIFRTDERGFQFVRDFEGMYAQCADPHGQSKAVDNLSYQLVLVTLARAVSILDHAPGELSLVDIGCGLGYFTARLKRQFPEAAVMGIDISSAALERAARIAPDCSFEQVDLKAPDLALPNAGRFKLAVALDFLYYFEDDEIDRVLSNINRLLADQGFLMVGYHLPEQMRFGCYIRSLSDARHLLAAHNIGILYSFEVHNFLDKDHKDAPVGHHLYFLARKGA